METDLSRYRMTDYGWVESYKNKMGATQFREYLHGVYRQLFSLHIGQYFDILKNVRSENYEIFIKICCLFISEGNSNYEFFANYTKIRRYE